MRCSPENWRATACTQRQRNVAYAALPSRTVFLECGRMIDPLLVAASPFGLNDDASARPKNFCRPLEAQIRRNISSIAGAKGLGKRRRRRRSYPCCSRRMWL